MLAVGALALVLAAPPGHAQLSSIQKKCSDAIAKSGTKYMQSRLKIEKKCKDADLKAAGGCDTAKRLDDLSKAEEKLAQGLDKGCTFSAANFANMGFPGQCADANPVDGFTTADLKPCIEQSHTAIANELLDVEYDTSLVGTLLADDLKCQQELSKNAQKVLVCVLKNVQKCRKNVIDGKLPGVPLETCRITDSKTASAIEKCKTKAADAIAKKCTNPQMATLKPCTPDQGSVTTAAACLNDTHLRRADSILQTDPPDLIDYQFADPGVCGDNIVNTLEEECDGTSDLACPGNCGTAEVLDGYFACLCKNKPRVRIAEFANADLDNGWTGKSHDAPIVETGGYILDLYDCDANGDCIVGPNCSLAPHSPCGTTGGAPNENADAICDALGQGTCRKERTAVGPHCYKNIKQECNPKLANDPVCNQPGDFCVRTLRRPPLPLSAGGVSVCNLIYFTEDVVGTTNIVTGANSVRYREASVVHSSAGSANKPCPVCGGFCAIGRERCQLDADCGGNPPVGNGPCITDPVCSDGPNQDRLCRRGPPFGGPTPLLGTPSVDCPPNPGADISSGGLDLLLNPSTTGTVTKRPSSPCNAPGFTDNACVGGPNQGRTCADPSQCPSGVCLPQCFCPSVGGTQQKPNACEPACVGGPADAAACTLLCRGGANDGAPCLVASVCPGGACSGDPDCVACNGGVNDKKVCTTPTAVCVGGPNAGTTCTVNTDCGVCSGGPTPGASCESNGDCGGSVCSGGANNGDACSVASECPGGACSAGICIGHCGNCPGGTCDTSGFCHQADCRVNPADTDSSQEGLCTVGPFNGSCSVSTYKGCQSDEECQGLNCTFCEPGETCVFALSECFVNSGIERTGTPGFPERVEVTTFCLGATSSQAINNVTGLPGPGAITDPMTLILSNP